MLEDISLALEATADAVATLTAAPAEAERQAAAELAVFGPRPAPVELGPGEEVRRRLAKLEAAVCDLQWRVELGVGRREELEARVARLERGAGVER